MRKYVIWVHHGERVKSANIRNNRSQNSAMADRNGPMITWPRRNGDHDLPATKHENNHTIFGRISADLLKKSQKYWALSFWATVPTMWTLIAAISCDPCDRYNCCYNYLRPWSHIHHGEPKWHNIMFTFCKHSLKFLLSTTNATICDYSHDNLRPVKIAAGSPVGTLHYFFTGSWNLDESWLCSVVSVECLVLMWGGCLCFQARKAPDLYNESRQVSFTLWNEALSMLFYVFGR